MSEQTPKRMLSREAIEQFAKSWDLHKGEEREMTASVRLPDIDVVTFSSPLYQETYPSDSPFAPRGSWAWHPGVEGEPHHYEDWITPYHARFVTEEGITDDISVKGEVPRPVKPTPLPEDIV